MNASTSIPTSIHLRPTRLAGLMAAAAAVAAVITWAVLVFGVNTSSEGTPQSIPTSTLSYLTPAERAYVDAVAKYERAGVTLYGPIYGVG
jgi:hypothetical protein